MGVNKDREVRHGKVRPVPISQMRVPPVDIIQRPYNRAQAEKYANDFDFQKFGLPLVNHRDAAYWLFDGQHRIGALKIVGLGDQEVDCEVFENLSDPEMARIFLGRDDRRRIAPYTKFLVACTAGFPAESEVRRLVEANHLKISRRQDAGCIGAVTSLLRVYKASGSVVLGQVLRTIRDAYASDPAAFDNAVIVGLGLVFNRYNGKTQEQTLIAALSKTPQGVRGLFQRARRMRDETGRTMTQCIAATAVDLYNRSVPRNHRLANWFKEEPAEKEAANG